MTTPLVPYITTWSEEEELPGTVISHPRTGIAYADESLADRDSNGVLWARITSRPGHGRPMFGQVHAFRQRRAMRMLRCQVCARPADRTDNGMLWLLQDHRDDWPQWPDRMGATEPPICRPCARTSQQLCPALRKGHVIVEVRHSTISGVYGLLYQHGLVSPEPIAAVIVGLDNPALRWTRASQLVRELHDCTIVNLDKEG